MSPRLLLDLSRLLSCSQRPAPSGIDRVELAYAEHFLASLRTRVCALAPWGRFGWIDAEPARRYVEALAARWRCDAQMAASIASLARRIRLGLALRGEAWIARRVHETGEPSCYLLVSHHHLERRRALVRLLAGSGTRFVCLVHDLIPITHAEYARPGIAQKHALRMQTAAQLADGLIFNSRATAAEFQVLLERAGRQPALAVAPLGVDLPEPRASETAAGGSPYFICVSTLEPRKNHLLLLQLWRQLAGELGRGTPRLVLVGRRGWENENALDLLERCEPIRGLVEEHNELADAALAALLRGARALLLPSFAEGYGLPVAEALAAGVPVICSNLPALREVGAAVPEYLDPLDGPAWRSAVLDYAQPDSPRRAQQLQRLRNWRKPGWAEHFAAVEPLLARVCAAARF